MLNAELALSRPSANRYTPPFPPPDYLPSRALLSYLRKAHLAGLPPPAIFIRSSPSSWQSVSFILFSDHSASATGSQWITCPFRSRCLRGFSMEFVGVRTFCEISSRRRTTTRMSVPFPYLSTVEYPFNF